MTRRRLLQALGGGRLAHLTAKGQSRRGAGTSGRPAPYQADRYAARFTDVARQAGLTRTVFFGEEDTTDYITESNGCGVAFYDYDNDGWLDILLLNGSRRSGLPKGATASNRLYRNNRDGTFTDVTRQAGLERTGWASGVCIGDFDNDGFDDLFISYRGENALYRNNGDGTFEDVTRKASVGGKPEHFSTGCTFLDYDRDGYLDLLVTSYLGPESLAHMPPKGRVKWKGVPVAYGPQGLERGSSLLYRNNQDGTFTDVTDEAQVRDALGYGLTAMATDYNQDGWPDIYIACDSSPSILLRNNRDGTFTDIAAHRGLAYSPDGVAQAGMGLAIGDYNSDGELDIVKTHFADDVPGLYRNDGHGFFSDESFAAGLRPSARHMEWGTGLVDFDNDGLPDLFYVTGSIYPGVEAVNPDYPYRGPRFLFRNLGGGSFENVTEQCGSGLTTPHSSRGCAFGDFDNDGDMDILVMNMNEPPSLIRCDSLSVNRWLKIKLIGVDSNRTAIGATVRVRTGRRVQVQEVHSQDSYLSVSDLRLHFGLGRSDRADSVRVRWPGGRTEAVGAVAAGQLVHIEEGRGVVRSKNFGTPSA